MTLTPEQLAKREGKVTASWVPYLMKGDRERIISEWRRLVYDDWEEPKFDPWKEKYAAMVEDLAQDHHEWKTGYPLTRRGEVVDHPTLRVCCTLDCYRAHDDTVIDTKAWSSWMPIPEMRAFLVPQNIVQRACVQCRNAALLISHGGAEPKEYPATWSAEYEAQVWERIAEFWWCVQNLTAPYDLPDLSAPIPAVREVCMDESNAWAEHAARWLKNRVAAEAFKTASAELKSLVPHDAKRAYGHGVEITKATNGALTPKEMT